MNQQELIKATEALAEKVGDIAMVKGDHVLALNALITAYMSIATAFPCCHQACSQALFGAAISMAQLGAQSAQPGQHIH
jgi:hypothetical protein